MPVLPHFTNHDEYEAIFLKHALWDPVIAAIQEQLLERNILKQAVEFTRCTTGSAIVYASERYILKLFSKLWPTEYPRELTGLRHFNQLSVPIPKLIANGVFEGENYILMERLPGESVEKYWKTMTEEQREHLIIQIGSLMSALTAAGENTAPEVRTDWPNFVQRQCDKFVEQQTKYGLSNTLAKELHGWLVAHKHLILKTKMVFLHCDLTHDHFLIAPHPDRKPTQKDYWTLTGLIDFGDAMNAHPLYEMDAPFTFLTANNPTLRRALLLAYGFTPAELNHKLENQLFCLWSLHRFVNVPYTLKNVLKNNEDHTLLGLQKSLFSLSN